MIPLLLFSFPSLLSFLPSNQIIHNTKMISFQTQTAHSLYLVGASLLLFDLCWGFVVGLTPFPKLALTAHIQFMAEGSMVLLAGFLTEKTDLMTLSRGQCWTVWAGMVAVWPTLLSEVANAWWGTKDLLPIVSGMRVGKGSE
jgi:(hydroxyamino)benzene mutase